MRVIKPQVEILDEINGDEILRKIERAGRVCYKSEERITPDSAKAFIQNILKSGHESVIEHEKVSVRIICDRGVTHEIVRHRMASYSQESTRYCNYAKDKFGNELTFIKPCFWEEGSEEYQRWAQMMQKIEDTYNEMVAMPNSLKTEIIVTMDLREWRHFFKLRTAERAHPQMREVAYMLLEEMKKRIDVVFDNILA